MVSSASVGEERFGLSWLQVVRMHARERPGFGAEKLAGKHEDEELTPQE